MEESLFNKLKDYSLSKTIPFHMPGHKRSAGYDYLNGLGAHMDLTEIEGFDNLHDPSGILKEGMELLAQLYGSKRSFYLINGSTGGILAAVRCAVPFSGKVIMARNCHKAVYNAVELVGAVPVYMDPPTDEAFGFCLDVPAENVERLLEAHPDTAAVIVTSPTYDGVVSDIAAIASLCHAKGIPLIVDEAHGAHLGFLDNEVQSAVTLGADIVIQSFHKTLPSLTQTAVAHICGELIDPGRYAAELSVFETSSPSYLLMASLDGCVRLLSDADKREDFFRRWRVIAEYAEERLSGLAGICVFGRNVLPERRIPGYDRSKLAISVCGMDGPALGAYLRGFHMEPEMISARYVLLMTGADTAKGDIDALVEVLSRIDADEIGAKASLGQLNGFSRERIMMKTPFEVRCEEKEQVTLDQIKAGAVSADYVFAYPPGIPIVVPGEVITEEVKRALREILRLDLNPATLHGAFTGEISVVKAEFVDKMY